ncbi:peptide ABC transporter ATP-binding protein [Candidatus Poribacteria bacterium]|nr:peptide ABC transporter ATP-binding protein [Candidatus Poribacteria bacterium]OUT61061.1 MAG: peptide ABC transporter ATP-binding protein [bacterium TMED15]
MTKVTNGSLLQVTGLKKHFPVHKGILKKIVGHIKAIDGISFDIKDGETVGLVGESGSGKTTTGRSIIRLHPVTEGEILFQMDGQMRNVHQLSKPEVKNFRRQMQMVFQNPFASLDPRMSIKHILLEPLVTHKLGSRQDQLGKVEELISMVGLSTSHLDRYPHELSGGQRQRVGIARSLALNPKLIICDEPVSALDVSVQAQVLNLLSNLQKELRLTYLLVAHDLSVVEYMSDRIIVMYAGKIVEIAKSEDLYRQPKHPYTEALMNAAPRQQYNSTSKRSILPGSMPDAFNLPTGCNFYDRCRYARDICQQTDPDLAAISANKTTSVACHLADELMLEGYTE